MWRHLSELLVRTPVPTLAAEAGSSPTKGTALRGFAVLPRSILHNQRVTLTEKMMLLALSSFAGDDDSIYPSHALLARLTSTSVATTKRTLESLRDQGFISWEPRRRSDGGQSSNTYTLHFDAYGASTP